MHPQTEATEQHVLAILPRAKDGHYEERTTVTNFCWRRYHYRVERFFSSDPAISVDDLLQTFWEGIWHAVPKVDGRGDPLYHLGQRGVWAVQSEVRQIQAQMKRRARALIGADNWNERMWGDGTKEIADPDSDFEGVLIESLDAHERIRILTHASLKPRSRQALDMILSGQVGDPTEPGFNKRLAEAMGVSEQRASQFMGNIRETFLA
jgi:hypothetical protein